MPHRRRYRSLFWPIVLIGAGVVWLLFSLDVFDRANAHMLALLWPILLVGLGLDLLIGRRSLGLGALIGVVTVGLTVVLMVVGPQQGWIGSENLITETRSVPVGQATSATISLSSGPYGANVHALPASSASDRALLAGTVNYTGTLRLDVTGEAEKSIVLDTQGRRWWFTWLDSMEANPWDIGLDPSVPIALDFDTASGTADLDLASLLLTSLKVGVSSGKATVKLPVGGATALGADLHLSSGDLEVQLPAGARSDLKVDISSGDASVTLAGESDVTLDFHGSSGQFTLQLPAGQACMVEVRQVSSGQVHMPSGFVRVGTDKGKEGTWQTPGYETATHKVAVTISISSGDVKIRQ
jgi:hypothetical protein